MILFDLIVTFKLLNDEDDDGDGDDFTYDDFYRNIMHGLCVCLGFEPDEFGDNRHVCKEGC